MGGPVFRAGAFALPLTRTYVMGILNVTPDSFSDGGKYQSVQAAVSRAVEMAREGADIIDIGGQSTRPGYQAISQEEEWARIQEVIPAVGRAAGLPVSVDTFYPWVAQRALAAGASILNDVTGFGEEMLQVAAGSDCGCAVMDPGSTGGNICARVRSFFLDRLEVAKAAGVSRERLCFDPGVGFGKTLEENLTGFADGDQVSSWAVSAMNWAVGQGIMNGKGNNTLDPQGTAPRAEVAKMLMVYLELK